MGQGLKDILSRVVCKGHCVSCLKNSSKNSCNSRKSKQSQEERTWNQPALTEFSFVPGMLELQLLKSSAKLLLPFDQLLAVFRTP